jgi:hypothetical protein
MLQISGREAVVKFNDFSFDLKRKILEGDSVDWKGVGILNKGFGGEIKFSPATGILQDSPVTAEKIIRERAEHTVRVGEDEKTSAEMIEILSHKSEKRSALWTAALILGLLLTLFLGWYFSRHGIETSSVGNTKKLKATQAGEPYKILP